MNLSLSKRKNDSEDEAASSVLAPSKSLATQNSGSGGGRGIMSGVFRTLVLLSLVGLILGSLAVFFVSGERSAINARYIALFDRIDALAQTVSRESLAAAASDEKAFLALDEAVRSIDKSLKTLADGDPSVPISALPQDTAVRSGLSDIQRSWTELREAAVRVVDARAGMFGYTSEVSAYEALLPQLSDAADTVVESMQAAYAPSSQLVAGARLSEQVNRISDRLVRTLAGGGFAGTTVSSAAEDVRSLRARIDGFLNGGGDVYEVEDPAVREAVAEFNKLLQAAEPVVAEAVALKPQVLDMQAAVQFVLNNDARFLEDLAYLRIAMDEHIARDPFTATLGSALGAGAVLMLLLFGLVLNRDAQIRADQGRAQAAEARRREEETRIANQENQDAILRLLDEIADLADGDLTINATVTEDITGAIADAINFSIETLRDTVININDSSVLMANAARSSRETALRLTQASETQASQIEGAASSIRNLADVARGVSDDAQRGQEVATQQLEQANEGAKAVRATIDGMDAIRETIQETSKRIKRLGESSQEIGDIVGLIDDIADQTNILALNAAIQASMAGEQGRGFAVVSDEVQRLAERASQATKQIEGLVKAIQSDTNEAVASMEQSTAGVVQGAELAEDAGQALVKIELVAEDLARLVSGISQSSQGQMAQADSVAQIMDEIQRITTEARAGTQETAGAIGDLAQLATDLRTSVSNFRLPDSDTMRSTVIGLPPAAEAADGAARVSATNSEQVQAAQTA